MPTTPAIQVSGYLEGQSTFTMFAGSIDEALLVIDVQLEAEPKTSLYLSFGDVDDAGTFTAYLDGHVLHVEKANRQEVAA